jgi:hypothetical protein
VRRHVWQADEEVEQTSFGVIKVFECAECRSRVHLNAVAHKKDDSEPNEFDLDFYDVPYDCEEAIVKFIMEN